MPLVRWEEGRLRFTRALSVRQDHALLEGDRQLRDGPPLEQDHERQLHPERLLHTSHDHGRPQRIPADVEEIVLDTDPLALEDLGPDRRDSRLEGAPKTSYTDPLKLHRKSMVRRSRGHTWKSWTNARVRWSTFR